MDGIIRIWDAKNGALHKSLEGHTSQIRSLTWSRDGAKLASCSSSEEIYLWDIASGHFSNVYKTRPEDQILLVAWSHIHDTLITGHDTGEIAFWYDVSKEPSERIVKLPRLAQAGRTYERVYTPPGERVGRLYSPVKCAAWSLDGRMVAWGADDSAIEVKHGEGWDERTTLKGHLYPVTSVSFSSDNRLLSSKSHDGTVRLWSCDNWQQIAVLDEPVYNYKSFATLAFHPQLPMLATLGDQDSTIRIWDLNLEELLHASENRITIALKEQIEVVINDESLNEDNISIDYQELIDTLNAIDSGAEQAGAYHDLILDSIAFIFTPELRNPTKEQKIHDGRKRVDIVCDNRASNGFFYNLGVRHRIECPYVFFECKNYSSDPKNEALDQLTGRFNIRRGRFGFLVCRKIEDRRKMNERCRDALNDDRGWVIAIDDTDVKALLQLKANGNSEAIDDYMEGLLRQLLM